ncbi:hypothetical protein AB2T78_10015 [Clostridium butyricum]
MKMNLNEFYERIALLEQLKCIRYNLKTCKNTDQLFEIVNICADFIENNINFKYSYIFEELSEVLVNIIEIANKNNYVDLEYLIPNLYKVIMQLQRQMYELINIELYYNLSNDAWIKKCFSQVRIKKPFDKFKKNVGNIETLKILVYDKKLGNLCFDGFNAAIEVNELENNLKDVYLNNYLQDYDFKYLNNTINLSKEQSVENIVVGNSYPMTGICEKELKKTSYNLALSSQDLYYSKKIIENVIRENREIKVCLLGVAEYLLYHDLSMGKYDYSTGLVKSIYYPLTKDLHNSVKKYTLKRKQLKKLISNKLLQEIFNFNRVEEELDKLIYQELGGYFNKYAIRSQISILRGKSLEDIPEEERWELGKKRAEEHNELIKYEKTKEENKKILIEIVNILKREGIRCILIKFPTTKYYSENIYQSMKNEFYDFISTLSSNIEFVDFSKINLLNEKDFIDFDHLNENGAVKVTKYIQTKVLDR